MPDPDRPRRNTRRQDPKEGFEGITYLFIPRYIGDVGAEPLPAGQSPWVSPALQVASNVNHEEAIAGTNNQVSVNIRNGGGIDAVNVLVECFITPPATAPTPLTTTLIGQTFVNVPGYSEATVGFGWVPDKTGHFCLLARAGTYIPPDIYADSAIFDIRNDRHVAVNNITVVRPSGNVFTFGFIITNPFKKRTTFEMTLDSQPKRKGKRKPQELLGDAFKNMQHIAPLKQTFSIGNQLRFTQNRAANREVGLLRRSAELLEEHNGTMTLEPNEAYHGYVTIGRSRILRQGEFQMIRISQHVKNRKTPIGGLTLLVAT
jgi:hypothetical protein